MASNIGMPKIKITFQSLGLSAIQRSERGILLLLLKYDGSGKRSFDFKNMAEAMDEDNGLPNDLRKYVEMAYSGKPPYRVKVETYGSGNTPTSEGSLTGGGDDVGPGVEKPNADRSLKDVLDEMIKLRFQYFVAPNATDEEVKQIVSRVQSSAEEKDKTCTFVGYNLTEPDNEHIINRCVDYVKIGEKTYNGQEFTTRVAADIAALPLTRSFTYYEYPEIDEADIKYSREEDKAVNEGRLFLTYDGEKYKIARAVNSLTTMSDGKGEDFCKIRVMEGMNLIKDDITKTFEDDYAGKILNTYENKRQFIALINNVYFRGLEGTVLDGQAEGATVTNMVDIDMEANEAYARTRLRPDEFEILRPADIKAYNTGSKVFLSGTVRLLDAMEDLYINFRNM